MVLDEELAGLEFVGVHDVQQLPPGCIVLLQIFPVELLHIACAAPRSAFFSTPQHAKQPFNSVAEVLSCQAMFLVAKQGFFSILGALACLPHMPHMQWHEETRSSQAQQRDIAPTLPSGRAPIPPSCLKTNGSKPIGPYDRGQLPMQCGSPWSLGTRLRRTARWRCGRRA